MTVTQEIPSKHIENSTDHIKANQMSYHSLLVKKNAIPS